MSEDPDWKNVHNFEPRHLKSPSCALFRSSSTEKEISLGLLFRTGLADPRGTEMVAFASGRVCTFRVAKEVARANNFPYEIDGSTHEPSRKCD